MTNEAIAADFRHALERLHAGTQTHPKLIGRRVRITASTVALEAGHSRNTLYASHRDVLNDLRALPRTARPRRQQNQRSSKTDYEKLREENAQLRIALKQSATAQVTLFERLLQCQRRCDFLERQRGS